jgi:uncharacterized RDD family membrane protein YckC/uncharacterized membrane protein SpoIIM required for sporulation
MHVQSSKSDSEDTTTKAPSSQAALSMAASSMVASSMAASSLRSSSNGRSRARRAQKDAALAGTSYTEQALVITSERVPLMVPIAGIGERAIAAFIDFIIVLLLGIAVLFVYTFFGRGDLQQDVGQATTTMLLVAAATVLSGIVLYDVIGDVVFDGRTPGKRLTGLRVIDRYGRPPDLATSTLRNLFRLVDMIPLGYGVGLIVLFFSGTRRIGDFVAGTVVISERGRGVQVLDPLRAAATLLSCERLDGVELTDDDVLVAIEAVRRSEGIAAPLAEQLCARAVVRLMPRVGTRSDGETTASRRESRAHLAAAVLTQAQAGVGLAMRLVRLQATEQRLAHALSPGGDAYVIDEAARVASSELLTAARRGVPARFLEGLSLLLLDVERRRRPPPVRLITALHAMCTVEMPLAVWAERAAIARAAVVLGGASVVGFLLALLEPSVGRALIGDDLTQLVEQGASWTNQIERDGRSMEVALSVTFNNVMVGLRLFALGILGGVATVLGLVSNGLSLGATFGMATRLDTADTLSRFILAHGPVELSMVCVAGAAGWCVSRALMSPGQRSRIDALRIGGRQGFLLVGFATIGFVVIGTVEGFISPGSYFPTAAKVVIGVVMWLLFFSWARLGHVALSSSSSSPPSSASSSSSRSSSSRSDR